MTRRFRCLPGSQVGGGPDFVYTPPSLPTPPTPPVVDNGEQPPSLGRPIDETDDYTGQVGSLFPDQPLNANYEPGASPEGDYIHVLETGDVVTVMAQQGGTLPSGLAPDTNYYVEVLGETSIVLYRDRARTLEVEYGSINPACGCVPIHYTWMDQWPPEQAFALMQVPEALLEPAEYIPVQPMGVRIGHSFRIYLYALTGQDAAAIGVSANFGRSGISRTFSHGTAVMGVAVGHSRTAMSGVGIANVQRLLGIQFQFDATATVGQGFADAVAAVGVRVGFGTGGAAGTTPTPAAAGPSWLEAELFNAASLGDDFEAPQIWLALDGDGSTQESEQPQEPIIIPGAPILDALLFNDALPADTIDARSLWLGMDEDTVVIEPPEEDPEPPPGPTIIPGASLLDALLLDDGPLSDALEVRNLWLGLDEDPSIIEPPADPEPPVEPEAPPEPDGLTWIESELWNAVAIADEYGPGGMALAYLGVESIAAAATPTTPDDTPPADEEPADTSTPWLEATLFNEAAISDDFDARKLWLGVDGTTLVVPIEPEPEVPPEPEWVHWTEYDLFNESAISDLVPMTQRLLGVG